MKKLPKVGPETVYMCGTDWHFEFRDVPDTVTVFKSEKDLKKKKPCYKECGIVAVTVTLKEWVRKRKL